MWPQCTFVLHKSSFWSSPTMSRNANGIGRASKSSRFYLFFSIFFANAPLNILNLAVMTELTIFTPFKFEDNDLEWFHPVSTQQRWTCPFHS